MTRGACRQMAVAYRHFLQPPHRLDWDVVAERQRAICPDGGRQVVQGGGRVQRTDEADRRPRSWFRGMRLSQAAGQLIAGVRRILVAPAMNNEYQWFENLRRVQNSDREGDIAGMTEEEGVLSR
jgi:hypothetical protein